MQRLKLESQDQTFGANFKNGKANESTRPRGRGGGGRHGIRVERAGWGHCVDRTSR